MFRKSPFEIRTPSGVEDLRGLKIQEKQASTIHIKIQGKAHTCNVVLKSESLVEDTVCTVLYCTILYYTVLYCTILYYNRFVCFVHHLSPMGPTNKIQSCPSHVWTQRTYTSLPGPRLRGFIAMQVQHFYTSSTNGWTLSSRPHVLTSSRFLLRNSEVNCPPAESRTHKFRLGEPYVVPTRPRGQPVYLSLTVR